MVLTAWCMNRASGHRLFKEELDTRCKDCAHSNQWESLTKRIPPKKFSGFRFIFWLCSLNVQSSFPPRWPRLRVPTWPTENCDDRFGGSFTNKVKPPRINKSQQMSCQEVQLSLRLWGKYFYSHSWILHSNTTIGHHIWLDARLSSTLRNLLPGLKGEAIMKVP